MPKKRRRKRVALFGRVLLPPSRPHTTKKGERGYRRGETRREEREALRDAYRRQRRRPE